MKKSYPLLHLFSVRKMLLLFLFTCFLFPLFMSSYAQGYVRASQIYGVSGNDGTRELVADNSGNTYLLASVTGNAFPTTIAPVPTGAGRKSVLVKLAPDGNTVWSRYLPYSATGTGNSDFTGMVLENGMLYLLGSGTATDMSVTNGSVAGGGGSDIVYARVDAASGTVLNTAYLGGSGAESTGLDLKLENGAVFITYTTTSADIPVTTGPAFTTGYDHVIQRLDAAGNIVFSTYTGSVATAATNTEQVSLAVENGATALGVVVSSTHNFNVTNGSVVQGAYDYGVVKLDANGNKIFSLVYGGTANELKPVVAIKSGEVYLSGYSNSGNYPVTDGSAFTGSGQIQVITKFNSNGTVLYSSNQAGVTTSADLPCMQLKDGALYLMSSNFNGVPAVNVTDGSTGGSYLIKLNAANGQTVYATRFAGQRIVTSTSGIDMVIENGKVYTMTPGNNAGAPVTTDGSTKLLQGGNYIAVFGSDGKLIYGTFRTTGNLTTALSNMAVANGNLYVSGGHNSTAALHIPVTKPFIGALNGADIFWAAFTICPSMPTDNNVAPLTQTVCAGGFTQTLTGNKVAFASSNMPILYRNGAPIQQMEIVARYQWQVADAPTGPWTNISGLGTQKDYSPPALTTSKYYRRLVLPALGCGDAPVSTSAVVAVLIGSDVSPEITAGIFNTCVGTPVDITVNVTGGAAPYSYSWDNGLTSTAATATATPTTNSVYTVTVTDNNGCKQAGQVIVNAYAADAGPATISSCAGNPVRIGTAPPAGLAGVTYSWSPATGLDNATAAQPLATPASTTTYTVSMTIPVSGGGTCTTTDQVIVNVVAAPLTANFAGDDKAVCKGGTLSLGTTAEAGFTYTWSPANYLSSATGSTVTFNAGSELPQPNSFTYTLTAVQNGCSFTDATTVSVLEVNAGKDLCGPRTVGTPDKMPGVSGKVFLWEKISGPGAITGATNTATTTVSASVGSSTTYRITASYLGVSCIDEVVVPECSAGAGCPIVAIEVVADQGCANTALGAVTLRAKPATLLASEWTYSWSSSPAGGLSATAGVSVNLTDNIERDVTLTITSVDNPSVSCSETIHINTPGWTLPVFTAQDHAICASGAVSIGQAPVAGYSYVWTGVSAANKNLANPSVSPSITSSYAVVVSDIVSGCITRDTAVVTIKPIVIDPGSAWTICGNAVIQLGSPARAGYTYSWVPAVASYQNGTTNTSAEPKVLIATSQDFTLTVTDTETGCSKDSTVQITVDNSTTLPAIANKTICAGDEVVIGNPGIKGVTYSWSPATGLSSTTVAQPVANPAASQIYTLVVTYYDVLGTPLCTKSGSVTVTVNAPVITMSNDAICPSGALYNLSTGVTVTGASTYSWSPALQVSNPAALSTTVKANPVAPMIYTLRATDAAGCSASASKTVSSTIAAPIAGPNQFVCVGSTTTLGDASNSGTITWSVAPAIAGTLSNVNAAAPVFTPAAGDANKSFVFTISQDISGCISTSSVTIMVRQLTLPAIAPQTVCNSAAAAIGVVAQPNISYEWTPATGLSNPYAASTLVNSVTSTRAYTLTANDLNGCFATSMAVVGVNPGLAPTVTVPDVTIEVGNTSQPFNPQINPGAGTYTYNWTPANQVNNPYIANATGIPGGIGTTTYSLAVTDGSGCTSSAQARLNVTQHLSTLPITLASFIASSKSCGVALKWKVQSAENFAHFVVERSSNGASFTALRTISYEPSVETYLYDDANAGNGRWIYRLKLVDINGKTLYSPMVSATLKCASNASLMVYPNPVNQYVNINSSLPVQRVVLVSMTGKVILRKDFKQSQATMIQLPLNSFMTSGVYLLQVWAQDGTMQHTKLVKE